MLPLESGNHPELRIIQVLQDYQTVKRNNRYFVLTPGYPYKWEAYRWMSIARIAASLGKLVNEAAKNYLLGEFKKTLKLPLASRHSSFREPCGMSSLQSGTTSHIYREASEREENSRTSEVSYIENSDFSETQDINVQQKEPQAYTSGSFSSEYREVSEEREGSQTDESYDFIPKISEISTSSLGLEENQVQQSSLNSDSDSLNSYSTLQRSSSIHSRSTKTSFTE